MPSCSVHKLYSSDHNHGFDCVYETISFTVCLIPLCCSGIRHIFNFLRCIKVVHNDDHAWWCTTDARVKALIARESLACETSNFTYLVRGPWHIIIRDPDNIMLNLGIKIFSSSKTKWPICHRRADTSALVVVENRSSSGVPYLLHIHFFTLNHIFSEQSTKERYY